MGKHGGRSAFPYPICTKRKRGTYAKIPHFLYGFTGSFLLVRQSVVFFHCLPIDGKYLYIVAV